MKEKRAVLIFPVVGIIFLGFVLLSILVVFFPNSIVDRFFSGEVQEYQNSFLDFMMKMISWPGYMPRSIIMVVTVSVIFCLFKLWKEAFFILLTLLSGVVGALIKITVNRPRPTAAFVNIIETTSSQSFPSGHVLLYVVFFGFLIVLMVHLKMIPRQVRLVTGIISLLFIFSVPFSRMYLGAHWFTDVLGGFLSGIICLYILSVLYLKN